MEEMGDQEPSYTLPLGLTNCTVPDQADWGEEETNYTASNYSSLANSTCIADDDPYIVPPSLFHFIILGIGVSVIAILGKNTRIIYLTYSLIISYGYAGESHLHKDVLINNDVSINGPLGNTSVVVHVNKVSFFIFRNNWKRTECGGAEQTTNEKLCNVLTSRTHFLRYSPHFHIHFYVQHAVHASVYQH